jgi:hypothetical protein
MANITSLQPPGGKRTVVIGESCCRDWLYVIARSRAEIKRVVVFPVSEHFRRTCIFSSSQGPRIHWLQYPAWSVTLFMVEVSTTSVNSQRGLSYDHCAAQSDYHNHLSCVTLCVYLLWPPPVLIMVPQLLMPVLCPVLGFDVINYINYTGTSRGSCLLSQVPWP